MVVGDDDGAFDGVDEGLLKGDLFDAAVVETVDIVPEVDLVFFVVGIFNGGDVPG